MSNSKLLHDPKWNKPFYFFKLYIISYQEELSNGYTSITIVRYKE